MKENKRIRLLKRSGAWVFIPAIVFLMMVPKFYVWIAEVPEADGLNKVEGTLVHKKISSRKGWKVGIRNGPEIHYFTCGYGSGAKHTCHANRAKLSDYEGLEGANATVWWYEQPIYLFSEQKRLVRLDVSGRTIISRSDTQKDIRRHAQRAPWWVVAYILFCLMSGAWLISLEKRKTHG